MKLLIIIGAICLLTACYKDKKPKNVPYTFIGVIDDRTDSLMLHPEARTILSYFDWENNKKQAAHVDLMLITDRKQNPMLEHHLADYWTTEKKNKDDDPHNREKLILEFNNAVNGMIDHFYTHYPDRNTLEHSEIFQTILIELQRLSNSPCSKKVLLVYSDLMENAEVNCYLPETQRLMRDDPEELGKQLLRGKYLPRNLNSISIHFYFQSRNKEQDENFFAMLGVYSQLLEPRGAKIFIHADNNLHYDPTDEK